MTRSNDKQQGKGTESLILQAAEREFIAKGFSGARTTSIAEAAGVTHAMFHYYFRTKEKLFDRIISEKIALLKKVMIDSIGDQSAPLNEIIKNLVNNHLDFIAANPDLPRFLVEEMFRNPDRAIIFQSKLHETAPSIIALIQEKIDIEAATGNCRKVDAGMLMLDMISLNIFPYMASPAINAALGNCMTDTEFFLTKRKKENYDTIMQKLKP